MSDAILARCAGYEGSQIEPFLRTCRNHYQGRIVLLLSNCGESLHELARAHKAEVVSCEPSKHPELDRFALYQHFLLANETIQACFMTDIRDVVFQGNPFRANIGSGDIKFYEEEACFSEREGMQAWSVAVYGPKELDIVLDKPILCSGTTLAGREAALEYTRQMITEINASPTQKFGTDQAIHNHIYYTGAMPKATKVKNGFGEVQTLSLQKTFTFNQNGELLNRDGSVPAVLHQYDRHRFLVDHFDVSRTVNKWEATEQKRLRKLDRSRSAAFRHFVDVAISRTVHR